MRDPEASLLDIVAYVRRVSRYVEGIALDEFVSDVGVQDQVIRCLSVIGEAARRTPVGTRDRFPAVPWAQMIGMRNRLSHDRRARTRGSHVLLVHQSTGALLSLQADGQYAKRYQVDQFRGLVRRYNLGGW